MEELKYCKFCGERIPMDAVFCMKCGRQVEMIRGVEQPNIIIENTNANTIPYGHVRDKWVAFFLCLFLGVIGAHKFYEGRFGAGILYLLTCGLFGLGWIVDCLVLLCKPNPYYV